MTQRVAETSPEFRALFESSLDAILVVDANGVVLEVNPAACKLYSQSSGELIGCRCEDLTPPEHRERARKQFEEVVRGLDHYEGFAGAPGGASLPVAVQVRRFSYLDEPAFLFFIRGASDREEMEERLYKAQRMESIGRLAGGVAHDFNNLLTGILGYADLCIGSLEPDHAAFGGLVQIRRAGELAAELTTKLLAFSRQQVLRPKVQNLNEIFTDVEVLLRRTLGEDVEVVTRLDADLELVNVDGGQLELVLLNLAVNARDAMPHGGRLWIETKNLQADEAYAAEHVPMKPGPYVALSVKDNGCGMSTKTLGRMFDPFFTTKPADQGTGLGLSTVYGIVKQSGGYIWADSKVGEGTEILVLLPPARGESDQSLPLDARPGSLAKTVKTVLLTEDHRMVRDLSARLLEEQGYRVLVAQDAEEALRINASESGEIDLLLTDIVLPGKDGLVLARMLLDERPATKALVMSGYSKMARFNPQLMPEGVSFLQKPFKPKDLAEAVALVLS